MLGYSRLLWCRFSPRQDMRTLVTGLEEAFLAFGGGPQELLVDRMKVVITRDLRLQGGALVHNLEFLRSAHHWGFMPCACRPYRAQSKGKVERPVRYVRENLVYCRPFLDDADLAQQCADWLERVANARHHGTTEEPPRPRPVGRGRLYRSRSGHSLRTRASWEVGAVRILERRAVGTARAADAEPGHRLDACPARV